eukprot:m51a1_g3334 putative coatomer subunit gamma-like (888) ;mRNA; f:379003-382858
MDRNRDRGDKQKEEEEVSSVFQNLDKGLVLQEKRLFNETPLNPRKCRFLIAKLLCLLSQGDQTLTRSEATDLFFAATKLFQSKDILLRRAMFLILKELVPLADNVIMMVSSLSKDITGKVDGFRSNAIRVLTRITDSQLLGQVERYMKQAIVDKEPGVASAALVSATHLMATSPDIVRRWVSEVQEAAQSRNAMVQYHALGLMQAIKRHDRLAVAKLVTTAGSTRSPYATCMLVRFAKQVIIDDASVENNRPLMQFLEQCLRHQSDMVVLEAARAMCDIPMLSAKELTTAVADLQLFLNSSKTTLRFAAVRTLNKLAPRQPLLVGVVNLDLENLLSDSCRGISTLAVSCLLKTGTEFSVERIIKQISNFVSDVPDEFRVQIVDALRALCFKYPKKAKPLVGFLSNMLRDEGGYEFKAAIVRAISAVIAANTELKDSGLMQLAEFIEDCEFTQLATEVLDLLAAEGPGTPSAAKYVRYIYNRTILENAKVRASSITALAKFALRMPEMRPQVTTLLRRCAFDNEDEIRDRAVFYLRALEEQDRPQEVMQALVAPELSVPLENLEAALEAYLAGPSTEAAFDMSAVSKEVKKVIAKEAEENLAPKKPSDRYSEFELMAGLGLRDIQKRLAEMPDVAALGDLLRVSPAELPLTEKETEYVVSYRKYTYSTHMLFEFTITNTLREQMLEAAHVLMKPSAQSQQFVVEKVIPTRDLPYNVPGVAYAIVAVPEGTFVGAFSSVLKFRVHEVDTATGEVDSYASDDTYPLDDAEVSVGDFVQPAVVPNFELEWNAMGEEGQTVETYNLSTIKTLQEAVNETMRFLGMTPCDGTSTVPTGSKKHILFLGGRFSQGDVPVLARIRMRVDPSGSGVNMELTVRSKDPAISAVIATAI